MCCSTAANRPTSRCATGPAGVQPLPVLPLCVPARPADRRDPDASDRLPALPPSARLRRRQHLTTVTPFGNIPVTPWDGPMARAHRPGPARGMPGPGGRRPIDFPNPSSPSSGSESRSTASLSRPPGRPGGVDPRRAMTSPGSECSTTAPVASRRRMACRWSITARPADRSWGWRAAPVLLWFRTRGYNRTAYDCLCTEIGLWASGLRDPAVTSALVTNLPGPAGRHPYGRCRLPRLRHPPRGAGGPGRGRRRRRSVHPRRSRPGSGPTRRTTRRTGWPTVRLAHGRPGHHRTGQLRGPVEPLRHPASRPLTVRVDTAT